MGATQPKFAGTKPTVTGLQPTPAATFGLRSNIALNPANVPRLAQQQEQKLSVPRIAKCHSSAVQPKPTPVRQPLIPNNQQHKDKSVDRDRLQAKSKSVPKKKLQFVRKNIANHKERGSISEL